MGPKLLIVEDDAALRRLLKAGLGEEGYDITAAAAGREALAAAATTTPAAMIIDIGLPDSDGRDLCQAMRAAGIEAPVLFLTALDSVPDRLLGFGVGADDYMTKPFVFAELIARVGVLVRRSGGAGGRAVGDLRLDPIDHTLVVGERSSKLTPTEFRLLGAMASRAGEVLRRRELVAAAWPDGAIVHDNTLDVYVGRLRRKLRSHGSTVEIHTVHQVGYELR